MIVWNGIALIEDDTHFTPWVKAAGRLDHDTAMLARELPHVKGTVLDIGANIGTHTVFYAKHAQRVIAFEPLGEAWDCLFYNTSHLPNVELYLAAAGREPKWVGLQTDTKNYGASYTVTDGDDAWVTTIDSLLLDACDYIKIDAEGDEIDVLMGAKQTIRQFKPAMCIEVNKSALSRKGLTADDLLACIRGFGYKIHGFDDSICCDVICV